MPDSSFAGLRIVDPHECLAAMWTRLTDRVGMRYLRSPSVHHIDIEPSALRSFAYDAIPNRRTLEAEFLGPYSRPSLRLFQCHLQEVLRRNRLADIHVHGAANRLERIPGGWRVHSSAEVLDTERVALCLGLSAQPSWPEWAQRAHTQGLAVSHVFAPSYAQPRAGSRVAVIGGGITAGQLALRLISELACRVTLLSRHPLRAHEFDADPGWMGPKYLAAFHATADLTKRRQLIRMARQRGTMPHEVLRSVNGAAASGSLTLSIGSVESVRAAGDSWHSGAPALELSLAGGASIAVDQVVLCTGYDTHRPGGSLVSQLIDQYAPPLAPCGYPAVPPSLEWLPGLFVTGALAELELGPVARNLIGARTAASRIREILLASRKTDSHAA